MDRKISLILAILFILFSAGCGAARKYVIKQKNLPKIPCKIAVVDNGKGTAPIFKEILEETNSFEEVMLVERKPSAEDTAFRQAIYDEDILLLYRYEIIPVALDGTTRVIEDIGEGLGAITRTAMALAGGIVTAPMGGIGATVTERGVSRIWPYRNSQRIKLDFWVTDVYTGEIIYSNSVVTTGSAMHMGAGLQGANVITRDKASGIATHNAFIKSTVEMIKNVSLKKDIFLYGDEEEE